MILTREIEVKITESNYDYFSNYGYSNIYIGDIIKIPVELLSKGSNKVITCQCDNCGEQKDVIFKNYMKYNNDWGAYYCRKCSDFRRKNTLLENYGVEYPIQSYIIRNKYKETLKSRYGVDNARKIIKKKDAK